jgi:hypothetical protein
LTKQWTGKETAVKSAHAVADDICQRRGGSPREAGGGATAGGAARGPPRGAWRGYRGAAPLPRGPFWQRPQQPNVRSQDVSKPRTRAPKKKPCAERGLRLGRCNEDCGIVTNLPVLICKSECPNRTAPKLEEQIGFVRFCRQAVERRGEAHLARIRPTRGRSRLRGGDDSLARDVDQDDRAPKAYLGAKAGQAAKSSTVATANGAKNPIAYRATCSFISLISADANRQRTNRFPSLGSSHASGQDRPK